MQIKFMMNTDNVMLKGRIARLNMYAGGKAMNVVLAINDPEQNAITL